MATNILHQVPGFVPSRGALSFPFSSAMNLNGRPLKTCTPLTATSSSTTRESQLLQAAASVAPGGIYICSNTNAGPTVPVIKDAMTGDYTYEARPMVHADRGVCENLKISAVLLSRFGLVFILIDKPDELLGKCVATPDWWRNEFDI
jgi:hypothetical protein